MSEKTQIILLAFSLIIIVIEHYFIFERLDQLERNQEVLRNAINKLSKGKRTNDYTNTTSHDT
jgi:preprotein translocase subunit YajC